MADITPFSDPLISDVDKNIVAGLKAAKSLVDGVLGDQISEIPTISEAEKTAALGYLDAHLNGFTKELLDMGLAAGGAAAIESLVAKADAAAVAAVKNLQSVIDSHITVVEDKV